MVYIKTNYPPGIQSPDIEFNGIMYDIKTLKPGAGETTIYNRINKSADQCDRFIIDITDSGLSLDTVTNQINKVFWSKNTKNVQEVIIIKGNDIITIVKRV